MNTCTICGYKVVSNKMFEKHKVSHDVPYPDTSIPEVTEAPTSTVEPEKPVDPVIEPSEQPLPSEPVAPVENTAPVEPVSDEITLRFNKPVEVRINGVLYEGKEIKVKNMSVAGEIVRICRDAYGPNILA